MSDMVYWVLGVLVMAVVTYIPRALPLTLMRRQGAAPYPAAFYKRPAKI